MPPAANRREGDIVRKWFAICIFAIAGAGTWPGTNDARAAAVFKPEEIEQLVAPIALYPDALVAQILMAATYPLEVVSAARWSKANPNVKGTGLEDAMEKQNWDASVKSLTAFPQVLAMMNDKLEMTQRLAQARAADSGHRAEVALDQPLAGFQACFQDGLAQLLRHQRKLRRYQSRPSSCA